jgi:hypothetical protein
MTKIVLRISGGVLQGASTDNPDISILLFDEDNIKAGDSDVGCLVDANLDKDFVDQSFYEYLAFEEQS